MAQDSSTLVSISNVLDPALIRDLDPKSPEFKRFIVSLAENVNSILLAVNAKTVGIHDTRESITGNKFFDDDNNEPKASYSKMVICGALPNTALKQIAHGLDSAWSYKFIKIYGASSDSANQKYIPLPYASATAADVVELSVDNTYINITTGKNMASFDTTKVYIEYLEI